MSYSDCFDELDTSDYGSTCTAKRSTPVSRRKRSKSCNSLSDDLELNQSLEERQALLEELKNEYVVSERCKPNIVFLLNDGDSYEGTTLEQYFDRHGPFPMEEHIVATILRNVTSALIFLHTHDVVIGSLDASSVILDTHFNAKIIVTKSIRRVRPSKPGMKHKAEDVFYVGLLLYRMLTGFTPKFEENGKLVGGPSPYMRVSEKGMKLVEYMLTKSKKFPPTMARVRYSDWLEECEENPPVFVLFPDDHF